MVDSKWGIAIYDSQITIYEIKNLDCTTVV
jgi:hypothetical protein